MKDQKEAYEKHLRKLKNHLKITQLELSEERKGHEENQKLTQEVMTQLGRDMLEIKAQTTVYMTTSPMKTLSQNTNEQLSPSDLKPYGSSQSNAR